MSIKEYFEEVKESGNSEKINEFVIRLSEDPQKKYLSFIKYFLDNLAEDIINQVKINLVYLIGKLSSILKLDNLYLDFLKTSYFKSDRWVRNEIIKAFSEIVKHQNLKEQYINLISISLKEDYQPIKENALEALGNIENLKQNQIKNLLLILDNNDSEIVSKCRNILRREIKNYNQLFQFLDSQDNYKIINKIRFRSILVAFFTSVIKLENFRKNIEESDWEEDYKKTFLQEIETYERILLKNI
jgi:hypothetical protein